MSTSIAGFSALVLLATPLVRQAMVPILAFSFGFARAFGLIAVLPLFTRLSLGSILRAALAFALALPIVPALLARLSAGAPMGGVRMIFMLLKEGALGLILGVVFSVPFWAAEMAGEIVDQQRGSQGAIAQGGQQAEQAGILGTLMVLLFSIIFLLSGGMNLILRGFVSSFVIWPVQAFLPHFTPAAALAVLGLLDDVTRSAVILAAPLMIAMLVAELSLGLLNRFAQQINVFDLALSIKALIVTLGLALYVMVLIGNLSGLLPDAIHIGAKLRVLTKG